jgi:flagellin
MSLGVLNNLSAVYAENNLNNTSNSLNTVLQQLSSGSKINSGADDAAGLSLVDGLQANQQALTQSRTNATEGVGLLQVADGALSQVTSLLNRAVTLATEASNGTLNSSQDAAANQEYQSILSEINNIGSTTTYNGVQVFGSDKQIYTSDSTTKGASENNLNITGLNTTSGVGNASGTMSYSTGQNVFIDLGSGANQGDALNAAATSTLNVSYANPAGGSALTTTISVGTGTAYANTVDGLMSAINNSGLNISASFGNGTDAGAVTAGAGANDTGIIITGSVSDSGVPRAAASVVITNDDAGTGSPNLVEDKQVGSAPTLYGGTTGTAAISYTATSGVTLSGDLSNQADAQSTLTSLNSAITDVAAQDGYVGAQINTLNAVSNVLSTQQENVQSAQNAVQATDYASATSNMSKYEILSQTGISALAQANSMQQEVTKLLQ